MWGLVSHLKLFPYLKGKIICQDDMRWVSGSNLKGQVPTLEREIWTGRPNSASEGSDPCIVKATILECQNFMTWKAGSYLEKVFIAGIQNPCWRARFHVWRACSIQSRQVLMLRCLDFMPEGFGLVDHHIIYLERQTSHLEHINQYLKFQISFMEYYVPCLEPFHT